MMRAVFYGRADMVKRAVEKNADVNFATSTGKTVLFQATVMGHGDVVQTLKRYGAKNQVEHEVVGKKRETEDKADKNRRASLLTGVATGPDAHAYVLSTKDEVLEIATAITQAIADEDGDTLFDSVERGEQVVMKAYDTAKFSHGKPPVVLVRQLWRTLQEGRVKLRDFIYAHFDRRLNEVA